MTAERTREVAALLGRVAGRELSQAELQELLSIAAVEGMGNWTGAMAGSQNLGSDGCTLSEIAAGGGATFRCEDNVDHHADGTAYVGKFKYYLDAQGHTAAENGAIDFMKQLSAPIRPRTGEVLRRGGSLYDLADAMHRERYFEGDARGGKDPVLGYAKLLEKRELQIARELGQAPAVSLGAGASSASSAGLMLLVIAGLVGWLVLGGA